MLWVNGCWIVQRVVGEQDVNAAFWFGVGRLLREVEMSTEVLVGD